MYLHRASWHSSVTLTEVFPCFFPSCKANARAKPAKTGHGPHSSKILCCMYCLFCVVLCIVCVCVCVCTVLYCTVLLPPGGYPIAVNNSYHTGWAKSRYTVINYILYTYFWPTLYKNCTYIFLKKHDMPTVVYYRLTIMRLDGVMYKIRIFICV